MTAEEFVKAVKIQTSDAAVSGAIASLQKPAGRKPDDKLVELSRWFNQLSSHDQSQIARAMTNAAQLAVFSFFCLLDGVAVIENGAENGSLHLSYSKGTESTLLNKPDGEYLHNLYKAKIDEATR